MATDPNTTPPESGLSPMEKDVSEPMSDLGDLNRLLLDLLGRRQDLTADLQPILEIVEQLRSRPTNNTDRGISDPDMERVLSLMDPNTPLPPNRSEHWGEISRQDSIHLPPLHANPAEPTRLLFLTNESSLFERARGEERSRLQMSIGDYRTVAEAFATLENLESFSAKELHEATSQASDQRAVPMTQIYLVLRFLRSLDVIQKAGGRRFQFSNQIPQAKITETAMEMWDKAGTNASDDIPRQRT